ncbi:uncharacterized protein [Hemitrygon akajei]|uniref:uncharacterized protein isoform X2 n=1 Tax=Hemitrygon akajei TaxID=2704970 RepID=UPI003BF9EBC3
MWTSIFLIGFLPVSGALWAEKYVRGVVGRAITIDCHYEAKYHSHTKYWCHGWTRYCSVLVKTNGQHGRSGQVSITDNPERGIFTVTMKNPHSGDTGWYSCGITTTGLDPMLNVHLEVSEEPVSVPVLRYPSPANISGLRGLVSLSCESSQGSLPIQYKWYEQTSSGYTKISDTNELNLCCKSFNHQHQQYYCSASNWLGARSSAMVNVTVFNNGEICSYVTEINGTRPIHFCENTVNGTAKSEGSTNKVSTVLSVVGILLMLLVVCLLCYLKRKNRESKHNAYHRGQKNETQEMATKEENVTYADLHHVQNNEAAAQLANNENGIVYAKVEYTGKSASLHSVTDVDNVNYADIKFEYQPAKPKQKAFSAGTPRDLE